MPDVEWYLYSHSQLPDEWSTCQQRSVNAAKLPNSIIAQSYYPKWAARDCLDAFWSPRHHLPRRLNRPGIVTIHDLVWRQLPQTMRAGGRLVERLLMPASIKNANKIICVSESTKADLIRAFPEAESKCIVIYEAACTTPKANEVFTEPANPFFLFVGTKEPRKNLDMCLHAWQKSGLAKKGFKLILAGGRGWKYELKSSISQTGTEDSVIDVHPNEAQLRELYATCHAVVMPSLYEGFGLPLVEAMAFAKPMITSNISSMPEIAGDAALLISPESVKQLADAFSTLAQDEDLHATLSRRSAQRSKLFSWDQAASQTFDIIQSAIES